MVAETTGVRNVSVRLTNKLIDALDTLADEHGVSRNAVLELACYESLERWETEGVSRDGMMSVLREKKQRTREGLMRSQRKQRIARFETEETRSPGVLEAEKMAQTDRYSAM